MKSKLLKISITIILLLSCVVLYNLPTISLWRSFNNGVRAFNEKNYDRAATEFNKAMGISDDFILKYNWCTSLWTDVMKKQKDLKITAIDDSSLTVSERNEITAKIEKVHIALNQLLDLQELNNKYLKKIYYAQGKLFLLEALVDKAKQSFLNSISKDQNFTLPQAELVKLKTEDEQDPAHQLLINIAEAKPIDIERKWNPF